MRYNRVHLTALFDIFSVWTLRSSLVSLSRGMAEAWIRPVRASPGALCANDLSQPGGMPMKAIEAIVLVPREWLFLVI
jgi:hypothetical protein